MTGLRSILIHIYFHNTNCTWVITAPEGQVVEVKFDFLELESNSRCRYDYVAAYDGPLINNTRLRHGIDQSKYSTLRKIYLTDELRFETYSLTGKCHWL